MDESWKLQAINGTTFSIKKIGIKQAIALEVIIIEPAYEI